MALTRKLITILFLIGTAITCWLILPEQLELTRKIPAFFAAISMLSMAVALWLSTRPRFAEPLFGGMDRAYSWHKWLGLTGILGACLHWLLVPGPAGGDVIPVVAWTGEEMGELAMYLLLVLGIASMLKSLPYRLWHHSHKLMGPIFIISVYHTFFSDVPFETLGRTGITLMAISVLGISSWVYKLLFYHNKLARYKVVKRKVLDGALVVALAPIGGKTIKHKPGQFAFLNFAPEGEDEFHPFTIASAGHSDTLVFYIKALGDHTAKLQKTIKPGQPVIVDGAYGRLHAKRDVNKPQIWLAGGVGITPFIAWLKAMRVKATNHTYPEVHLFFSSQGHFLKQIITILIHLLKPISGVYLHPIDSGDKHKSLLNSDMVIRRLNRPLSAYQVFACGPQSMMTALRSQLLEKGLRRNQWHNESINMR